MRTCDPERLSVFEIYSTTTSSATTLSILTYSGALQFLPIPGPLVIAFLQLFTKSPAYGYSELFYETLTRRTTKMT